MSEYFRSSTVTGKSYDIFKCVKILNIQQAISYMDNNVYPVDIKISVDNKTKKKCLVFYFDKQESHEVYDLWCKRELN